MKNNQNNNQKSDKTAGENHPDAAYEQAKTLYWEGRRISWIAAKLGIPRATVASWCRRDGWAETNPTDRVMQTAEQRLCQLIRMPSKGNSEYKEMDALTRMLAKLDERREEKGMRSSEKQKNRKRQKNEFLQEDIDKLQEAFEQGLFEYQRIWYEAGLSHRVRMILKSRQIGATWYFARESILDALTTGRNQVFLSASKAQAHVFKRYIQSFVMAVTGIPLSGDPISIRTPNSTDMVILAFLGTNARTAQSYNGNLYIDEIFWIPKFKELQTIAKGMALHKKWRQTYFSVPSTTTHEARAMWTGEESNKGRPKEEHKEIDLSHEALAQGRLCEDGIWRMIVTVEDAAAMGCNLFDLEQVKRDYSPDEYANQLMCQFIDTLNRLFSFEALQECITDFMEWPEYKPFSPRPLGEMEVAIGYDPANSMDSAGLVVMTRPRTKDEPFRIIEALRIKGLEYVDQAQIIRNFTEKYHVTHICIDVTGLGSGVSQLVSHWFPQLKRLQYSVESKTEMVLKTLQVLKDRRLQWDLGYGLEDSQAIKAIRSADLMAAFLSIRRDITPGGHVTYVAGRSQATSHADIAWATMQALCSEALDNSVESSGSIMIF